MNRRGLMCRSVALAAISPVHAQPQRPARIGWPALYAAAPITHPEGSMSLRATAGHRPRRRRRLAPGGPSRWPAAEAARNTGQPLGMPVLAAGLGIDGFAA